METLQNYTVLYILLLFNHKLSMKLNQAPQAIITGQQSEENPVEEPADEPQTVTTHMSLPNLGPMEADVPDEVLHMNTPRTSTWKTT